MDFHSLIDHVRSAVADLRLEKFTGKLTVQINFKRGGIANVNFREEFGSGKQGEMIVRRKIIKGDSNGELRKEKR